MVILQYIAKQHGKEKENMLYNIQPSFSRNKNKIEYYNDKDNEFDDDSSDENLSNYIQTVKEEPIVRYINTTNESKNVLEKEQQFLKIQKELEEKRKLLASKKKEMTNFMKDEIEDIKSQQLHALERLKMYISNISGQVDDTEDQKEINDKISELNNWKNLE